MCIHNQFSIEHITSSSSSSSSSYYHQHKPKIKSNFSVVYNSALLTITLTFVNSKLLTISWTTIIFFVLLSNNVNDAVGLIIANGNPGNPPPVPTSIIFKLSS